MTADCRRRFATAAVGAAGVVLLVVAGVTAATDLAPTRADADSFTRKLLTMTQYGEVGGHGVRLTPVTEREVNAYLHYDVRDRLPKGVVDPVVQAVGNGRLTGRAMVDLDEIRRTRRSSGLFDPMQLLSGRLPVVATGVLRTAEGRASFDLETASVGGIPVSKSVLQELVTFYTRSAEAPRGVDLDQSFELPARIVEIHVDPGRAVVVQR